jgi:hypothetical protein
MTQKRLEDSVAQKLKQMFFDYCVRVSFEHKVNNNHSDETVLIAKKNQNQELFRVQKTYKRNSFSPNSYSVRYAVIICGKVIADVTLKDTDAEYLTDFPERELYMLLIRKRIRQQEAAECLGNAFIKALRDEQQLKIK